MKIAELAHQVRQAQGRIVGRVRRTPVIEASVPTPYGPRQIIFKLEHLQYSGSFKARGALNTVLGAAERGEIGAAGVAIASGGNAGIAAAWAAGQIGCRAAVFVHGRSPQAKIDRLRALGAEVHIHGAEYADAAVAASDYIGQTGALAMHAYDLLDMVAGAGTAALELTEQAGQFDDVCIAVGGGGWLGGLAAVLPTGTAIGIEPTGVPTLRNALENNRPVDVQVASVAADSLGARQLGQIAFDIARQAHVRSILVGDSAIIEARNWLWGELRLAVEHAAATALAPLLTGAIEMRSDRRVAVLLCGANTELKTIEASEQ